eukprot:scaffold120975_cov66-Phaeocystis_antarctica.AAC.6
MPPTGVHVEVGAGVEMQPPISGGREGETAVEFAPAFEERPPLDAAWVVAAQQEPGRVRHAAIGRHESRRRRRGVSEHAGRGLAHELPLQQLERACSILPTRHEQRARSVHCDG